MKIVTTAEMIQLEQQVIASGVSAADLMEQAGKGMARHILAGFPQSREALIVAGKGNNGGDGLAVAHHLADAGWQVRVVLPDGEKSLRVQPRRQLTRLCAEHPGVMIHSKLHEALFPGSGGIVVDALLGIGAEGKLRGPLAETISAINAARAQRFFRTVALDVPSGLPGDPAHAIVADLTITVGAVKDFLVREDYANHVGRLATVPLFEETPGRRDELLTRDTLAPLLPRRPALSHKNTFGRAVIVGGSPGFTGAPLLAAKAALRTGAGLVNLAVARSIYPIAATRAPAEVMVLPRAADKKFAALLASAKSIAVGPGLGTDSEAQRALAFVLKHATSPVVVDADALTLLSSKPTLFKQARAPLILTPHPGEMRRLLGREFTVKERPAIAREFAEKRKCVVVLKGTRTVITAPGKPLFYNSTGNPGLATGGSGDTLTGIIAGLLAQGLQPDNAARLGVWLHGRAADLALLHRGCEEGLLPSDVCEALNLAIVSLRSQD